MNNFWSVLRQGYEGQETIRKSFLALAPIAGYSDQPMRLMCKKYGVDVTYSEMISSEALFHNKNSKHEIRNTKQIINHNVQINKQLLKTLRLIQFSETERPYVVQIFGADPEHMAYAAGYIAEGKWFEEYKKLSLRGDCNQSTWQSKYRNDEIATPKGLAMTNQDLLKIESIPDGIDVNMGCPAHDVTKNGAGVALMKNPKLACQIIKEIKKKVKNIPVSVKTRLGWSHHDEILDFAKKMEEAGADAIAIHGRTYKEGFSGPVDWEMIEKVKKMLSIPVIGNGGINSNFQLSTNNYQLDGFMIGMGALGHPWIFEDLKSCKSKVASRKLTFIKQNILEHTRLYRDLKGDNMVEFRKILLGYLKGLENASDIRKMAVKIEKYKDIEDILKKM